MQFKASLDPLAKGITFGVIALFVFLGQKSISILLLDQNDLSTIFIHLGTIVFFVGLVLGCYLFSIRSYAIKDRCLIIQRPIGNVKIAIKDIQDVRPLAHFETRGIVRTFGVGGLFGYFGKFYIPSIGSSTFYATQRKNKILIITKNDQNLIITPDDISLVEKLKPSTDI
jgi:hypothetical protein